MTVILRNNINGADIYTGLSGDAKPAAVSGSSFFETDTLKHYLTDGVTWLDVTAGTAFAEAKEAAGGALAASENHLGAVGGNSNSVSVTPTITAGAYVAGNCVGGILTLTNLLRVGGPGTGIWQSMLVIDKGNQKAPLDVLLFDSNPSGGTYTDHVAISSLTTDLSKLIRRVSIAATDYVTVNGVAIADLSSIARIIKGAAAATTLYAVLNTSGTPTYASTSDLTVRFGALQD